MNTARSPFVSYDLETHQIQAGLLAPPIVCGSTAGLNDGAELLPAANAVRVARGLLSGGLTVAGANIAYDFGCLAAEDPDLLVPVFDAYAAGRVWDIQVAQALDAIAGGHLGKHPSGLPLYSGKKVTTRYSLSNCVLLTLGRSDAKDNDFWRRRYAILERVPMAAWPDDAVQYPKDDANNTLEVAEVQRDNAVFDPTNPHNFKNTGDLPRQCETAFAMHLGAVWGLRTDRERVESLEANVAIAAAKMRERWTAFGFLRADGTEDGSKVKARVVRAYATHGAEIGPCRECGGKGRTPKRIPCRGVKRKGRFLGCTRHDEPGEPCSAKCCAVCSGTGLVDKAPSLRCRELGIVDPAATNLCAVFCVDGEALGCDGTGLDLRAAPTLPRTDKGSISTSRDTLSESGDEILEDYAENEIAKIESTYLPFLKKGLDHPINLRPNVIVASGRTSYEDPIHQAPRGDVTLPHWLEEPTEG